MRETTFLKQNEQKWKEFEQVLGQPKKGLDPDTLADLFVELTDDLAYARTHYPDSQVVSYLNNLAAKVHQAIYRNKRQEPDRFLKFWTYEVPLTVSRSMRSLGLAFAVFMLAAAIGFFSAHKDENFLRLILGDRYVNMTKRNIKQGEPMGVYARDGESDTFFAVTFNNVRVSFLVFVAGLLFSAGTVLILFQNGIMVGAFIGFMEANDVLLESLQSIFIHGTLELSAIVIAAAAGLEMGNSLLFPKTYSRLVSLRMGAMKGLKIIAGLIPVFIVAGFLEGFVTRHGSVMPVMAWTIIVLSSAFIIWYFIIYPFIVKDRTLDAAQRTIRST